MTPRLKRTILASPLLLCGALGLGLWSGWPVPWIPQPAAAFPQALGEVHAALAAVADVASTARFVHTGHRGGSTQEFAKSLHGGGLAGRRPVAELLDQAFDRFGLDAIEVDVRASPLNDEDVVVVHDAIDPARLDAAGRAYAEANTVRALVEHFLARGDHRAGRRIAFEVKAPQFGLDAPTREAVDRMARTFDAVCAGRADEAEARAALTVLTFNVDALVRCEAALGPAADAHALYLIVTSNQFPEWLYGVATQPPFSAALEAQLRGVPWVRGVFFDPRFVDGFGRLFNGINADREARGLRPLELHLSTCSHEPGEFVARLAGEPERLRHVHGLIHEIQIR